MSDTSHPRRQMAITDMTPVRLQLSVALGVAGALFIAGGGVMVSQSQIASHTQEIAALQKRAELAEGRAADMRVLLERIDERTSTMAKQMDRIAK